MNAYVHIFSIKSRFGISWLVVCPYKNIEIPFHSRVVRNKVATYVFKPILIHLLDAHILACEEDWRRLAQSAAESRLLSPGMQGLAAQPLRTSATPLGAPLILSPRMSVPTTAASLISASAPPTMEHPGLIYASPYGDYTNFAALTGNPLLTEYADHSGGLFAR